MFGRWSKQNAVNETTINSLATLTASLATLERRISRLDDLGREGPDPDGIINRLMRERNKAREDRDKALAEVARLKLQIHGPQEPGTFLEPAGSPLEERLP